MANSSTEGIPAWMVAQALVIKAKNMMMEEAIDLLYKEIEAKRMAVNGAFTRMSDKEGEMEQGIFLINNLMEQREGIRASFMAKIADIEAHPAKLDSNGIEVLENAKKFLAAVQKITELTAFGRVFEQWFEDASMRVDVNDAARALADSCGGTNTHRSDALRFLAGWKVFREGTVFTEGEKKIVQDAIKYMNA